MIKRKTGYKVYKNVFVVETSTPSPTGMGMWHPVFPNKAVCE